MHAGEGSATSLASRIAAGHAQAFREFFDREAPGLIRYATALLGSREDARDAAQESFFRLWQHRDRLDASTDPARLLYTIVRNLARDRLRHREVERRPYPHFETPHAIPAAPLLSEQGEDA